jgi:hypothetical protein
MHKTTTKRATYHYGYKTETQYRTRNFLHTTKYDSRNTAINVLNGELIYE